MGEGKEKEKKKTLKSRNTVPRKIVLRKELIELKCWKQGQKHRKYLYLQHSPTQTILEKVSVLDKPLVLCENKFACIYKTKFLNKAYPSLVDRIFRDLPRRVFTGDVKWTPSLRPKKIMLFSNFQESSSWSLALNSWRALRKLCQKIPLRS